MLYKDDWDMAKTRLEAWWAGEVLDRAVIQVHAPRKHASNAHGWTAWNFPHNLDEPEKAIEAFDAYCKDTFFGGEAFPNLWVNFGPGVIAAFLGIEPRIDVDTVWFEQPMSWNDVDRINAVVDGNVWWSRVREATALALEMGQGKWITGLTDLGGSLDVNASLRGAQDLLLDLIDCPEKVDDLSRRMHRLWFDYYDGLFAILKTQQVGTSAWMGIWSPLQWYPLQCDFSAMLSPEMFASHVAPFLAEQCRALDHSIYHWDGPGQLPHLDHLLDIDELDGIQWTPGAGQPGVASRHWHSLYRRIQAKGKRLVLIGAEPSEIEGILKDLKPQGLLISTWCANEEEAVDLLRHVERWTRG